MVAPLASALPSLPALEICLLYMRGVSVQAIAIRYSCGTRDVEAVLRANSESHKEKS